MEVMKTTLSHLDISTEIDILLTIRTKDDGPWDEEKESKACTAHDQVYGFLADCVAHKKAVYALLKSLKVEDPS